MKRLLLASVVGLALLAAGCGHKDLKAPCSADGWSSFASPASDSCGEMIPVNTPAGASTSGAEISSLHEPVGAAPTQESPRG